MTTKQNKKGMQREIRFITAFVVSCAALFALIVFRSHIASAADGAKFSFFETPNKCGGKEECGWTELVELGNEIIDFAVFIAIIGATLAFALAGFKMMLNSGNSSEISKAKKMMSTAAIGIVITLSAWLIVDFILDNLGVEAEFRKLIP